jgi:ribosome maturation factor RimP
MELREQLRADVAERVTEIAERVAAPEKIEVVEVEWKGSGHRRLLRIYIDRPGGVTHSDCEFISKQVGTILDMEDVIQGAGYTLEVSSPGAERKLRKPEDFERFAGRKAKVLLRNEVGGQRHWEGRLAGVEDGKIVLDPSTGEAVRFSPGDVERASLKLEL